MKKISRDKSFVTEFGAHLKPELVVDLGESFVIETNDNWWNLLGEKELKAGTEEAAARCPPSFSCKPRRRSGLRKWSGSR